MAFTSLFAPASDPTRRRGIGGSNPVGSNPVGAEYNVPFGQIRGPGNTVNINSGQENRGDAFEAFSRYYAPMVSGQLQVAYGQPPGAGGPNPEWMSNNKAYSPQPQAFTGDQLNQALMSMFQRMEDAGTLSRFSGFSNQSRRAY